MVSGRIARWLRGAGPAPNGLPLEILLSSRAVVGGEWSDRTEARFGRAIDAEEFILALDLPPEPTVLRVEWLRGPDAESHAAFGAVTGHWLLDAGAFERPRRLPEMDLRNWEQVPSGGAAWDANWSRWRSWLHAWEECPSPSWAIRAAARVGVGRDLVVAAAVACVRASFGGANPGGPTGRLLAAVEAAVGREGPPHETEDVTAAWLGTLDRNAPVAAVHHAHAIVDLATASGLDSTRPQTSQTSLLWLEQAAESALYSLGGGSPSPLMAAIRGVLPTVTILRAAARPPG